jgi:hypothetical protein
MACFVHNSASEEAMGRFICALAIAMAISSATVPALSGVERSGQAQAPVAKPGTEKVTPQSQAAAKNLMQDITTEGCIRLWRPQTDDPTKMPDPRGPGLAGVYLLTPLASSPNTSTDVPTYLLTPSATINFQQHLGHKVMVTGTAQTAPLPPTVQEIATPPARPEEKPTTNGMPRLTVTSFKMVTESCP